MKDVQKKNKEHHKQNKAKFNLTSKPIHKRTEHLHENKNEKIKTTKDRVILNKKLAQVEAEYRKEVEAELARGGPDAAAKFEKKIAACPEDLHSVLMTRA